MVAPPFAKGGVQNRHGMYFVYLLKSEKDNGYYVGQTDDIDRRVNQHRTGRVDSTF
jgi:predicted GIY-YIG superfamily endonuclease